MKAFRHAISSLDSFMGHRPQGTPVFISVDVEALMLRAPDNHVDRLIWGKTAQGEFGIRRLSDILRKYRLKGNFLVDLAGAAIHGEDLIYPVFDYLLGEGHEVHAHLHPEMLADSWKWERAGIRGRRFNDTDAFMTRSLLAYAARLYERLAGRAPFLFRSGGYLFNRHTVDAAAAAGFLALSNFSARRHGIMIPAASAKTAQGPFRWSNGIAEIPVDISSPERLDWKEFLKRWWRAHRFKESRTFNLVFHSWTLLRRNADGHHLEFAPEFEEKFERICSELSGRANVLGYEEYLKEHPLKSAVSTDGLPLVPPFEIRNAMHCAACFALIAKETVQDGRCPGCRMAGTLTDSPIRA